MELRHLRYMVAVAETLHFTQAAGKLHVAQPALSRQIRQLEEELGVRLFIRNKRKVTLTPAGKSFAEEARFILERSESVLRSTRQHGKPESLPLNLGYVWGLFHSRVPSIIARFRNQFPDTPVHLLDLTATQQVEALQDGRIDAGFIGFEHEAAAAGFSTREIALCGFVAALPDGHPLSRRKIVPVRALASEPFLFISEAAFPGAFQLAKQACNQAGFRPRIVQVAERGHTLLGLIAGQGGVALIPEPLISLPHPGVAMRPLSPRLQAPLCLAWNPRRSSPNRDHWLAAMS